jgi:hypothetical protein
MSDVQQVKGSVGEDKCFALLLQGFESSGELFLLCTRRSKWSRHRIGDELEREVIVVQKPLCVFIIVGIHDQR